MEVAKYKKYDIAFCRNHGAVKKREDVGKLPPCLSRRYDYTECFAFEYLIQSDEYKESVLPKAVRNRVAVEAASTFGWHKYVGLDGEVIALDHFGASAPAGTLFKEFGFTVENVVETALKVVGK